MRLIVKWKDRRYNRHCFYYNDVLEYAITDEELIFIRDANLLNYGEDKIVVMKLFRTLEISLQESPEKEVKVIWKKKLH